jgi:gamma-glutamylcyclotransferase (GGCT)/AIG2-like uncharacterized protein YtfP
MVTDRPTFFFYGTLQAAELSEPARAMLPKFKRIGEARTPGRLFAIRAPHMIYPALLLPASPGETVAGIAYAAEPSFTEGDLALLDSYEEYFPEAPSKSEYLRKSLSVILKSGEHLSAWVYVYNFPLPENAEPIPSGDFKAYLAARR